MDIEQLKQNTVPAAASAATNIFGVLAQGDEAAGKAQNWFIAGAGGNKLTKAVPILAEFVRAYPTAPEEALWRTIAGEGIGRVSADAWEQQSVATRAAYTAFRKLLLLNDELIAEVEKQIAIAAQANAGPILSPALLRPESEQITGLAEDPTGPREGFELRRIDAPTQESAAAGVAVDGAPQLQGETAAGNSAPAVAPVAASPADGAVNGAAEGVPAPSDPSQGAGA